MFDNRFTFVRESSQTCRHVGLYAHHYQPCEEVLADTAHRVVPQHDHLAATGLADIVLGDGQRELGAIECGLDPLVQGFDGGSETPLFKGVKALIVDDEPMNLVVATSLFREYDMIIETAPSGREAIKKYRDNDYDVIFMDHMMPEMDGVEAMKLIKASARDLDREIKVIALTANAVSGAREMFIREGFDGFIAKPINTADFERTMLKILPSEKISYEGRCDK